MYRIWSMLFGWKYVFMMHGSSYYVCRVLPLKDGTRFAKMDGCYIKLDKPREWYDLP